jgi:cyclophilin family peptidyl-prolyl cis-trans isomerase
MTKVALAAFVVFAVGCGGGGGTMDPTADGPADEVTTFDMVTSKGTVTLETHRAWAPNGVDRFRELVDAQFYDDVRIFRVISGFVAQFGINGTPATDAMWSGRTIPDDPVVQSNKRGFITFAAESAPNSRTTQLFINLVDNTPLDRMRFAPFAVVTAGMDVVDAFDAEYGEAPDQEQISAQGNAYLTANFPDLDSIISLRVHAP